MRPKTSTDLRVRMRKPTRADAARLHEFVLDSTLETNSRYAYLLLASHFRDTCLVAERGNEVVGFVVAYLVPRRPDTVFVWQIGVSPSARRSGLGLRMLRELVRQVGAHCLEATVERGNHASGRLFESLGRELDTTCSKFRGFSASDFGSEEHEDEVLFRVGPWEHSS